MILCTSFTLFQQKRDGQENNIAGRHRTLTQKYTKEFYFIQLQKEVDGSGYDSAGLLKTAEPFNVSLAALRNGGPAYKDLGMIRPVTLSAAGDVSVKEQLEKVPVLWGQLQGKVGLTSGVTANPALLAEINVASVAMLATMNKAVGMLARSFGCKSAYHADSGGVVVAFFAIFSSLLVSSIIRASITTSPGQGDGISKEHCRW